MLLYDKSVKTLNTSIQAFLYLMFCYSKLPLTINVTCVKNDWYCNLIVS